MPPRDRKTYSMGSPDVTMAGRSDPAARREQPASGSSQEARASRYMVGVTLTIACTLGLIGAVFLQIMLAMFAARGGIYPPPVECVEGEAEGCPANYTCVGSSCVALQSLGTCQVGDSCDTSDASCRCASPLTCRDQVCAAELPPPACEQPAIQKLLAEVYKSCGNIQSCPEDKLEDFIIDSADFDEIVTRFPGTVTVHFPGGAPSIKGKGDWPALEIQQHYVKMLSAPAVAAAIGDARDILLIGRSSRGRNDQEDRLYSKARIAKVTDWLARAAKDPAGSDAVRKKIRTTILGSRKTLQPDFFTKHYANRIVAWSPAAEKNLRAKLPEFARLDTKEKSGIRGQINQVVFIIPIGCAAPEAGATP